MEASGIKLRSARLVISTFARWVIYWFHPQLWNKPFYEYRTYLEPAPNIEYKDFPSMYTFKGIEIVFLEGNKWVSICYILFKNQVIKVAVAVQHSVLEWDPVSNTTKHKTTKKKAAE